MECTKLETVENGTVCHLCGSGEKDDLNYGEFYKCDTVTCHYYCLLFSSKLIQNGEDQEGIMGFLTKDIKEEIKRGRKLRCSYCRKYTATVGCSVKHCKKNFHFPCGVRSGSLHQFYDNFLSFCKVHRPTQKVPPEVLRDNNKDCPICYESVDTDAIYESLWAPCCRKTFFHRPCIQKVAVNSGYFFFKCPTCNNKEIFNEEMKKMGIYIPEMDASWERVPNAFNDLLYTHNFCNVASCKCPSGRDFSQSNGSWRILRCNACGSQGTHLACSGFKVGVISNVWRCQQCSSTLNRTCPALNEASASTSQQSNSPTKPSSPKRARLDSDSDSEPPAEIKNEGSGAEKVDDAIVIDSDDSDVEILELPTQQKQSEHASAPVPSHLSNVHADIVARELLTNEGKTIKVHKLHAGLDGIPSEVKALGGVMVKPNCLFKSIKSTASEPVQRKSDIKSPLVTLEKNFKQIPPESKLVSNSESAEPDIKILSVMPQSTSTASKLKSEPSSSASKLKSEPSSLASKLKSQPSSSASKLKSESSSSASKLQSESFSSPSQLSIQKTSSQNSGERVHLSLGSSVSLFPVPTSSASETPKIPHFRDVIITPVPSSSSSKPLRDVKVEHKPAVPSSALPSVQGTESTACNIKINDVRHTNEFFQSPIIPIVYYPITTSDGRPALQPLIPLPPMPLQFAQSMQPQPRKTEPDVVTLD